MEQLEPRNKPHAYMVNSYLTKILNGEKTVSLINDVGNGFHVQKNKTSKTSCLIPFTKINSRGIKVLNVIGPETIKFLEKNTGKNLLDISLGNNFLEMTPKAKTTEATISKWDYIKLKRFYTARETINKMKRQPTE